MESADLNAVISQEDGGQRHLTTCWIACVQANTITVEKSGIGLVFAQENASLRGVGGLIQGAGNVMRVHGGAAVRRGEQGTNCGYMAVPLFFKGQARPSR